MKSKEIERYLAQYPYILKWVNECPACHSKGYKPDMPEHIGNIDSIAADNIRKMLRPMEVDELGFCMCCSKFTNR